MSNLKLKFVLQVAVLSSIATFAFADGSAPVYDADNYSPQVAEESQSSESSLDSPAPLPSQPESQASSQADAPPSISTQQKIAHLEQQLSSMRSSDSSARLNSLQSEVQSLRGQVEQLNHQMQQLQNQVRTNYSDLDKRVNHSQVVAKQTADPAASVKPTPLQVADAKTNDKSTKKEVSAKDKDATTQPNVAEEQQIYQTAYNYIKVKKYNEAVTALQSMLKKYPSGQFAANAHYWLGELYGLMNKNEQSAAEFSAVVKNYPDSPKISDAQLKLGLIFATQLNWPEAKSSFKKVINKYPGSTSARVAAAQLKQIKLAGH